MTNMNKFAAMQLSKKQMNRISGGVWFECTMANGNSVRKDFKNMQEMLDWANSLGVEVKCVNVDFEQRNKDDNPVNPYDPFL